MELRLEADWGVEIAPDLPEIAVPWEGFVDLRGNPAGLQSIPEAADFPALARALAVLNDQASPVFTAKCDVWNVAADEIDPYEFATLSNDALFGVASYIDVIEHDPACSASFAHQEELSARLTGALRELELRNGRVDLVVRAAVVDGREGYGITLYAAGCGADAASAQASWESVLGAAVLATIGAAGSSSSPAPHSGE